MTGYHAGKSRNRLSRTSAPRSRQTTHPPQTTKDEPDTQGGVGARLFEVSTVCRWLWKGYGCGRGRVWVGTDEPRQFPSNHSPFTTCALEQNLKLYL